jgi:hypothetical protein
MMNALRFHASRIVGASIVVGATLGALLVACSGNDKSSGLGDSKLPQGVRSEAIEHESCDDSSGRVETLDTNNDGKPDIRSVYGKSGQVLCRIVDLNHDGKADLYEYFDGSGTIRRREYCYDDTGVVNAIEYFENGKLVRREYDTSGQHRIDTWDFFDPNAAPDPKGRLRPLRRERDTTGDGRVDQWWTWDGDKLTIAMDKTGDGKPDPEETLVIGGSVDDASAPLPTASSPEGGATSTGDGGDNATTDTSGTASAGDGGPSDAASDAKQLPRNLRPR